MFQYKLWASTTGPEDLRTTSSYRWRHHAKLDSYNTAAQYCTVQTARARFWQRPGLLIPMNLMVKNAERERTAAEQKLGRWVSENVRADRQTYCVMRSCAAVVPMILRADNSAIPTEDDNSGEGEHLNNSWGLATRLLCEPVQAAYFT